ncbi:MAG: hypothetical protein ACE5HQ_11185 [Gemmatimonadota bacterium]
MPRIMPERRHGEPDRVAGRGWALAALSLLLCAGLPASASAQQPERELLASVLDSIPFRLIGPSMPAGRVWQVVGVPSRPKTFYVCTADGGVWKSDNHGTTLRPIFNHETAASCGAVAVAPSNPDVVWVGTGETASTRANSLGRGVFSSRDGGRTWRFAGLENTEEISAVVIDPRSSDTVYVAALGHLWGTNPERGIFKTEDAGAHWRKVLFVNDTTGFSDLVMDPHDPDVLYAAAWQRLRFGGGDMAESGGGSGIYKSTDAGEHWERLSAGLPPDSMGKITLAVARGDSRIVYAAILTGEPGRRRGASRTIRTGGVFRSSDGGGSWTRVDTTMTSYYYNRIAVDPNHDDHVWMPVFHLRRSDDGGRTWVDHNMRHVHDDLHSIWIDPGDSDHMIIGGDGGVNSTFDGGRTWIQHVLPIGQFYTVEVDDQDPYWVYGGMQDTDHWMGPSRTYDHEGITDADWIKLRFNGDGMPVRPDPRDPNVVYMVEEFGNTSRLDLHNWSRTELQPDPGFADSLGLHPLRWNWTPPMRLDVADPDVLYLGANYLFRCRIERVPPGARPGHRCEVTSPDLSAQQDRELDGIRDGYHSYGSLFSFAQSTLDPKVLWTGADDGPLWVSQDGGAYWSRVDVNLPAKRTRGVVSYIEPSRADSGTVYVAYDAHARDDRHPYLFRTRNYGKKWKEIDSGLPSEGSAFVIREDPRDPRILYVGTEFGLYVSLDEGKHWIRWKSNLPMAAIRDMVIQPREQELVVATFGRAIWIGDIGPLPQLAEAIGHWVFLFDVKPATAYNVRYTYGATIEELNGDLFFRAENPPYGAIISYYQRAADSMGVKLVISDASGRVLRTLDGPGTPGLHRVVWDLEPERTAARTNPELATISERQAFRRVAPGHYRVTLISGGVEYRREFRVRAERDGVRLVLPRK